MAAAGAAFTPGSLLQGAWDLLREHPLPLLLPLVVMGLVGLALMAIVLVFLLLAAQVVVWLVTMESARLALARREAPRLGEGWRSV